MYFLAFVTAVNAGLLCLFSRGSAKGMVYFLYGTLSLLSLTLLVAASGAISDTWLNAIGAAIISSMVMAVVAFIAALAFQWDKLYFNVTLGAALAILLVSLAFYGGLAAVIGSVVGMVVLVLLFVVTDKVACR